MLRLKNTSTFKLTIRIISIFIIHTFFLSNIAFAIPQSTMPAPAEKEVITSPNKVVIPRDFGLVKTRFQGKEEKLIVHIQDAHCNYEAQSNIVKILENLIRNYNLSFISVEGAEGMIDTTWFKSFPDEDVRREVATYFMKKGEITGPEFLSITTDYPIKLFGAETKSHYIKNLNAFTTSYPLKEATESYFNEIKTALNRLKTYIYTEELKEMDQKTQDYEHKKMAFNDYVRYLQAMAEKKKVNLREYDNFFKLVNTLIYEKKIDFSIVDKERNTLIDELTKKLSKDEISELVMKSLTFKVGKITSAEFYAYLRSLARDSGIEIAKSYPNLSNYVIYVSVYSKIDNEKLFEDIEVIEDAIKEGMFKDEDQRTLDRLSYQIDTLLKLVNIRLLNNDFEYYEEHKDEFSIENFIDFIEKQGKRYGLAYEIGLPTDEVTKSLPKLENFYRIALKRDRAIVDNTIEGMKDQKVQIAVLITGGFHTEGITNLLGRKGVSYLVVSPTITKDAPTRYIEVLTNQEANFNDAFIGLANVKDGTLAPYPVTHAAQLYISGAEEELRVASGTIGEVRGRGLFDRVRDTVRTWAAASVSGWIHRHAEYASNAARAFESALNDRINELATTLGLAAGPESVLTVVRPVLDKISLGSRTPAMVPVVARRSARGAVLAGAKKAPGVPKLTLAQKTELLKQMANRRREPFEIPEEVIRLIRMRGPAILKERVLESLQEGLISVGLVDLGDELFFDVRNAPGTPEWHPGIFGFYVVQDATVDGKQVKGTAIYLPKALVTTQEPRIVKIRNFLIAQALLHEYTGQFGRVQRGHTAHEVATEGELTLSSVRAKKNGVSDLTQLFIDEAVREKNLDYLFFLINTYDSRKDSAGTFLTAVYRAIDELVDKDGLPETQLETKGGLSAQDRLLAWFRYSFETSSLKYNGIQPYDRARLVSAKIDSMIERGLVTEQLVKKTFFKRPYENPEDEAIWIPQSFVRAPPEWFVELKYRPHNENDDTPDGAEVKYWVDEIDRLDGEIEAAIAELNEHPLVADPQDGLKAKLDRYYNSSLYRKAWRAVLDAARARTEKAKVSKRHAAAQALESADNTPWAREAHETERVVGRTSLAERIRSLIKEREKAYSWLYLAVHRPFIDFILGQIREKKREKMAVGDTSPVTVSIFGSGGCGKSTLVHAVIAQIVESMRTHTQRPLYKVSREAEKIIVLTVRVSKLPQNSPEQRAAKRKLRRLRKQAKPDVLEYIAIKKKIGLVPTDTIGLHPGGARYIKVAGGERLAIVRGEEMYSPNLMDGAVSGLLAGEPLVAPEDDRGGLVYEGEVMGPDVEYVILEGITPTHYDQVRDKTDICIAISEELDEPRFDRKVRRDTIPKHLGGPRGLPRTHVVNDFIDKWGHERHDIIATDIYEVADIVWMYDEDRTSTSSVWLRRRSCPDLPKRKIGVDLGPKYTRYVETLKGLAQRIASHGPQANGLPHYLETLAGEYRDAGEDALIGDFILAVLRQAMEDQPLLQLEVLEAGVRQMAERQRLVMEDLLRRFREEQAEDGQAQADDSRQSARGVSRATRTYGDGLRAGIEEVIHEGRRLNRAAQFVKTLSQMALYAETGPQDQREARRREVKDALRRVAQAYPIFARGWLAQGIDKLSPSRKATMNRIVSELVEETQQNKKVVTVLALAARGGRFAPMAWHRAKHFFRVFDKEYFLYSIDRALRRGQRPEDIFILIQRGLIGQAKQALRAAGIRIPNENFITQKTAIRRSGDLAGRRLSLEKLPLYGLASMYISRLRGPDTVIVFERPDLVLKGETPEADQRIVEQMGQAIDQVATICALEPTIGVLGNPPVAEDRQRIVSREKDPPTGKGYIFPDNAIDTRVGTVKSVARYHEKPEKQPGGVETARFYVEQGATYNASYFVARADFSLKSYEMFRPDEYRMIMKLARALESGDEARIRQVSDEVYDFFVQPGHDEQYERVIVQQIAPIDEDAEVPLEMGLAMASLGQEVARHWVSSQGTHRAVWAQHRRGANHVVAHEDEEENIELGPGVEGCNVIIPDHDRKTKVHVFGAKGLAIAYEVGKRSLIVEPLKAAKAVDGITRATWDSPDTKDFVILGRHVPTHPRDQMESQRDKKTGNYILLGNNGFANAPESTQTVLYSEEGFIGVINLEDTIVIKVVEDGVENIYVYGPDALYEGMLKLAELSPYARKARDRLNRLRRKLQRGEITVDSARRIATNAAAEFTRCYEERLGYLRDDIEAIVMLATHPDEEIARATHKAWINAANDLWDYHTEREMVAHDRIIMQTLLCGRHQPTKVWRGLDRTLKRLGIRTEEDFVAQYKRWSRPRRMDAQARARVKKVIVVSKVKVGSEIAINSIVLARLKEEFPNAEIILFGSPHGHKVFGGDGQIAFRGSKVEKDKFAAQREMHAGKLRGDIAEAIGDLEPDEVAIFEPVSRGSHFGLVPPYPTRNYFTWNEVTEDEDTVGTAVNKWIHKILGDEGEALPEPRSYTSVTPDRMEMARKFMERTGFGQSERPTIVYTIEVSGDDRKDIGVPFDRLLIKRLVEDGFNVVVRKGYDPYDEAYRVEEVVRGLDLPQEQVAEVDLEDLDTMEPLSEEVRVIAVGDKRIQRQEEEGLEDEGFLAAILSLADQAFVYSSSPKHMAAAAGTDVTVAYVRGKTPAEAAAKHDSWFPGSTSDANVQNVKTAQSERNEAIDNDPKDGVRRIVASPEKLDELVERHLASVRSIREAREGRASSRGTSRMVENVDVGDIEDLAARRRRELLSKTLKMDGEAWDLAWTLKTLVESANVEDGVVFIAHDDSIYGPEGTILSRAINPLMTRIINAIRDSNPDAIRVIRGRGRDLVEKTNMAIQEELGRGRSVRKVVTLASNATVSIPGLRDALTTQLAQRTKDKETGAILLELDTDGLLENLMLEDPDLTRTYIAIMRLYDMALNIAYDRLDKALKAYNNVVPKEHSATEEEFQAWIRNRIIKVLPRIMKISAELESEREAYMAAKAQLDTAL